jgi:hypothetical protein
VYVLEDDVIVVAYLLLRLQGLTMASSKRGEGGLPGMLCCVPCSSAPPHQWLAWLLLLLPPASLQLLLLVVGGPDRYIPGCLGGLSVCRHPTHTRRRRLPPLCATLANNN